MSFVRIKPVIDKKTKKGVYERRVALFLIILAAAFIFWSSLSAQDLFQESIRMLAKTIDENRTLGSALFVALAALSAMLSPFSSVPLLPLAVAVWGKALATAMLLGGWLIGDTIAYYVGYSFGHAVVEKLVSAEKMIYYEKQISKYSRFWMILLFRLAFPSEIGYAVGIIRYPLGKFLAATFLAELPIAILATYSSEAFLDRNLGLFITLVIATLLIVTVSLFLFGKFRDKDARK